MAAGLQAFVVGVSRFLSQRRLASFLITAVTLVLMAESIQRVLPDARQGGVLMWAFLAGAAYAAIATAFWVRKGPQSSRLFIAWFSGITPALCGMAAALSGSPALVMWLGVLLAIGLRLGRRGRQTRMTSRRVQCCSDRRVVIFHPLDPRTTFLARRPKLGSVVRLQTSSARPAASASRGRRYAR
jgi:hypothetical protein